MSKELLKDLTKLFNLLLSKAEVMAKKSERSKADECMEFLQTYLSDGPKTKASIRYEVKKLKLNFNEMLLHRARLGAGIKFLKNQSVRYEQYWFLPEHEYIAQQYCGLPASAFNEKAKEGPQRESAMECLKGRTKALRQYADELTNRAARIESLVRQLKNIENYASWENGKGEARQESGPHIAIGSDAEHALWEMAQNIRVVS